MQVRNILFDRLMLYVLQGNHYAIFLFPEVRIFRNVRESIVIQEALYLTQTVWLAMFKTSRQRFKAVKTMSDSSHERLLNECMWIWRIETCAN